MRLCEERRARLLSYCQIEDPSAEDLVTVEGLYLSAVGYMENAGVAEPEAGTTRRAQYDQCVNYLVLDGYDRRDMTITGTIVAENPVFRRLINQLKLTEDVSESGTSKEE